MKIALLAVLQLCFATVYGQSITYSSRIIDSENNPVAFATVQEIGTKNAVQSNENGTFTLKSDNRNAEIQISFVGYETKNIQAINGKIPATIQLSTSDQLLDQVVVTALGIERNRQSLGSSVTKISTKELNEVPLTNLVNSLAGQIAGVQVTNGSSGVGSSSRIVIRGENSLSGSNQPLFVVDGVPISNEQITSNLVNRGALQEVDYGNGGADLNPDDIESITILKGAGSAALYGTRAANGVVVITTKRGKRAKGIGVSFSSSLTLEDILTMPDYQNVYGGGGNGDYSFQNGIGGGVRDGGISSYGPKLDQGQLIKQFDSPSVDVNGNPVRAGDVISRTRPDGTFTEITPTPWISNPNNVRDFFKIGVTSQTSIAVNSATESNNTRISYSNLRNEGMLPNTDLNRDGLALSLDQLLGKKLSIKSYVNYVNTRSKNRPNLGYGYENVMYGFNWTGRNFDTNSLKNYWQAGQVGKQHFDFNYLWLTNPYLTLFENTNSFNKNRVFGNISATYDFSPNLSLTFRNGMDSYDDRRQFRRAVSTNQNPAGSFREDNVRFREINSDVLLSYKNDINNFWKYGVSVGANRFDQTINYAFSEASQLALPNIYTLANSRTPLRSDSQLFSKRINSVYGIGNISYQNMLYLDLTYRNDWSSTLPTNNNSFGYYSAGLSYLVSNMFTMPEKISSLNVRASIASVGNDTNPYQNAQNFLFNQNYGSNFRVTNETVLQNANLRPERLTAVELGLEAGFFKNRLQIDVSAYQNTSVDQIISRPISSASGFQNFNVNGGEVRTRGFEALISGNILKKRDFSWDASVNYTSYRSIVTRLPEGVDQFVTGVANVFSGSGGSNSVFYIAREGGRVGDMYGSGFVQVDGKTLYGSNGLPIQDNTLRVLGNYNPDFSLGFNNRFAYKGLEMKILVDWRQGGTLISRTKALGSTSGVLKETLVGREDGVIGDGVVNVGTPDNPQYVPNTKSVPASTFYNNFFDRGNEASATYDASYVKLRQVALYYTIPASFVKRAKLQSLKIGFVGSNLLVFTENPHVDPELNAFQETNIIYGVDDMSYPSARSYGFSIKTEF